jgi:hypothetical protein
MLMEFLVDGEIVERKTKENKIRGKSLWSYYTDRATAEVSANFFG